MTAGGQRHVGVPGRVQPGIAELLLQIDARAVDDRAQRLGRAARRIGPARVHAKGARRAGDRLGRGAGDLGDRRLERAEVAAVEVRPAGAGRPFGVPEADHAVAAAGDDRAMPIGAGRLVDPAVHHAPGIAVARRDDLAPAARGRRGREIVDARAGIGPARASAAAVARRAGGAAACRRAVAPRGAYVALQRARRRVHQWRQAGLEHGRVKPRRALEVIRQHQRRLRRIDRRLRALHRRRIGSRAIRRHEHRALVRAGEAVLRIAERLRLVDRRSDNLAAASRRHHRTHQQPVHARVPCEPRAAWARRHGAAFSPARRRSP